MSEIAIKVNSLSKKFAIGKKKSTSLRDSIASLLSSATATRDFWALKDVNFEINKGESIGIIGKNGAGKSTLLKVLSRITKPTR
ncbi:MAG TPA: ABC transporter ATP-binding protein, partial [Flavobacteriales bacterium]|nr:ABC transporter ATP-binding protein [Flavobacteriales bacterium]